MTLGVTSRKPRIAPIVVPIKSPNGELTRVKYEILIVKPTTMPAVIPPNTPHIGRPVAPPIKPIEKEENAMAMTSASVHQNNPYK